MNRCKAGLYAVVALLSAAVVTSPLQAGLGDLDKLLKKGKDITKKKDLKKATDEGAGKAGGKGMSFSKAPIDPAKPENLTTSFKAGEHIYGLITLKESFRAACGGGGESKKIIEVKCFLDGKYHTAGHFNITLRGKALEAKQLVLDVAPDPAKMTAYKDPNVAYQKQFESYGKVGGPMQLTKMLSKLSSGKHTIKLTLYKYKDLAVGEFSMDGDDYKKYDKLYKKLAEGDTGRMTMPKAKMTDPKLEKEMIAALKASQVKEAKEGKILKVVIIDSDWFLERHKISGRILFRYIRAIVGLKDKDGACWKWKFVFRQDFIGNKFQKTKLHGIHEKEKILEKNIK